MIHQIEINENTTPQDVYRFLCDVSGDFGYNYTKENAANKPAFLFAAAYEDTELNDLVMCYAKFANLLQEAEFSRGIEKEIVKQNTQNP